MKVEKSVEILIMICYNNSKALYFRKRKIASTLTFLGGCFAATDI
ncbi:hypothetical protein AAAU52_09350 [Blautia hansenii]